MNAAALAPFIVLTTTTMASAQAAADTASDRLSIRGVATIAARVRYGVTPSHWK